MNPDIYLFEDEGWKDLLPLTYLRPVSELRCGVFTLRERIEKVLGVRRVEVLARQYLSETPGRPPIVSLVEGAIYINGRLLRCSKETIVGLKKGEMSVVNDEVVAFRAASGSETELPFTRTFLSSQRKIHTLRTVDSELAKYPWDLIRANQAVLVSDSSFLRGEVNGFIDSSVKLYGDRKRLSLGENSRIEDFSILHLERGPIHVGKDVHIRGFTSIEGPCYIGDATVVEGAKLQGSSFGPECRLSGEIEASIFQGYSNKHHGGFLGHSLVGEWVNLGAETTNSDLKNNYSEVRVQLGDKSKSTGLLKFGCIIGDHTKTGIGTLINTGAVFGVFCNVLGGKLSRKYLPSFSWDTGDGFAEYEIDRAVETARIVMGRRGLQLTAHVEAAMREVFRLTEAERQNSFT